MGDHRQGPTVIVVDDERNFAKRLAMEFEEHGFRARAITDGAEARDVLERERPDLVVLDVRMPGVDGIQCLRRFNAAHGADTPPVILLTGDISPRVDAAALVYPGSFVLTKPVGYDEVIDVARQLLATAAAHRPGGGEPCRGG